MLVPIVCFTCGMSLGDIAPIYQSIRRKRMGRRYGHLAELNASQTRAGRAAPTQAAVDPSLSENVMGDVLDALRVTKCCRTRLVTAMIFSEHY
jgi:DNA-directed RNA polymerase subunit N (RpoN/RPB10)